MSVELNEPTRCEQCGSENVNPKQCNGVETIDGVDWWYGSFDCRDCGHRFQGAMKEEP